MKEFVRIGARKWQEMNDEQKEPFKRMAEVDKVRYDRERVT